MKRLLLATTLGVLPLSAMPSFAACVSVVATVTCTGTTTTGYLNATGGLSVTVESGASVSTTGTKDAIRIRGDNNTVVNNGTIDGTLAADGVSTNDGLDAGNGLTLTNNGTILATNKGVDVENKNDLTLTNAAAATIHAYDKAIRNKNGNSAWLWNEGLIESDTDEGFETGNGAEITNKGTIRASDDGIQVGEDATILNYGLIESVTRGGDEADPQDGIDIDSGTITNYSTGTIRSDDDAAIDYDATLDPSKASYITNYGTISGTTGVLVEKGEHIDPETGEIPLPNTAAQIVENWGLIEGRSGFGVDLGAGKDVVNLYAGSQLKGGADLGKDDDSLTIFDALVESVVGDDLLDGGEGVDTISFVALDFSQLLAATFEGGLAFFTFANDPGYTVRLANWESYGFGKTYYSQAQIEQALAPVPLPAAGLLMIPALGALVALRRRRG